MNDSEQRQLSGLFAMYAAYFRQNLPDEVCKMYAADLNDLEFLDVKAALESYRKNPKNRQLPLPSMLRELIKPVVDPESASREIAARVQAAIPKFGWANADRARDYIGEIGWQCVQRQGGWQYICEHHGLQLDPGVFQAQVRELAKASLTHSPQAMNEAIGLIGSIKGNPGELQSAQEIMGVAGLVPKKRVDVEMP